MRRHRGFDRVGLEGDLILHEPSFALVNGFTPREVALEPVVQPDESALVTAVPEVVAREVRITDLFVRSDLHSPIVEELVGFPPRPLPGIEREVPLGPLPLPDGLQFEVFPDFFPIETQPVIPSSWWRREQLTVPVAPDTSVSDEDMFEITFEGGFGLNLVLPRYELALDRVGAVDEPRISIVDRNGTDTLTVTLVETMSPAAQFGAGELAHVLAVTLKYRVPVLDGGGVVQVIPFPLVTLDANGTVVTAELPLATPGLRQQLLAALGSLEAGTTLVVGRGIQVGVPTGSTFPDGAPAYTEENLLLEWTPQPAPLILSDAHRARLGGGDGGIAPMLRIRIPFGERSHSYWQDPARPERYYFTPDRFLLARTSDSTHRPVLRVRVTGAATEAQLRTVLEFHARPVLDPARLEAARPTLQAEAAALGATGPVRLEILPEVQPLLRLALPLDGAAAGQLTERPGTEIDLELGLLHAETFGLEDFRVVYEALFGASLSLLRGEIRIGAGGGAPEDVPLELRLDRTAGQVLAVGLESAGSEGFAARLTNLIESPVRIDQLSAVGLVNNQRIPLAVTGLEPGHRIEPGGTAAVILVPTTPVAALALDAVALQESGVVVEPDREAIWRLVFDNRANAELTKAVTVRAVPQQFTSPDRPNDQVVAFVVTIERGETVQLTPTELSVPATVRVPVAPLLTGDPVPPIRYRTETVWQSGGIGTSPWRETDATILLPIKTAPV
ncbi:MAG: hypothetical protein ACRDTF_08550 [Pseudonocardiaceae bacterium]